MQWYSYTDENGNMKYVFWEGADNFYSNHSTTYISFDNTKPENSVGKILK